MEGNFSPNGNKSTKGPLPEAKTTHVQTLQIRRTEESDSEEEMEAECADSHIGEYVAVSFVVALQPTHS